MVKEGNFKTFRLALSTIAFQATIRITFKWFIIHGPFSTRHYPSIIKKNIFVKIFPYIFIIQKFKVP